MMRSMYAAVSGLRVHQTKMDVIGNNIANVNTVGYKKGQVTFQEAFNEVIRGGSGAQDGKGGTNPQQIGLGVNMGSMNTIHTPGASQRTDNPTDLKIEGNGYFVVSDSKDFSTKYYTRAGNFAFDEAGNLVNPTGMKVLANYVGPKSYKEVMGIEEEKDMYAVKVSKSIMAPASTTTAIKLSGNLDSSESVYDATNPEDGGIVYKNFYVKDSLGNDYTINLEFTKKGDTNGDGTTEWQVKSQDIKNAAGDSIIDTAIDETIEFDTDGKITGTDTVSIKFDSGALTGSTIGDTNNEIEIELKGISQIKGESEVKAEAVIDENTGEDKGGRKAGKVTGYSINASGEVVASFSNGAKEALWRIQIANFDNPMGLEKIGGNLYDVSQNSGDPNIGNPNSGSFGSITAGVLEMSNVDLSNEFTEMITTQRGFQANSRVITTTDEMLQELVNMKR